MFGHDPRRVASTFVLLTTAWIVAAVAVTASVSAATNTAASPAGWNLATDFRVAPDQANPNPDSLGHSGVWHFLQSASLAHNPAGYSLLPEFITDRFNIAGLESWQGAEGFDPKDRLPSVSINARPDNPAPFGIDWPPGTIVVHPPPGQLVLVGWRSPISGNVQVAGGVTDRHTTCGDGISWSVDKGATTLASGAIPNGGSQLFASGVGGTSLASVQVAAGDFLYFVVSPGPFGDNSCDSTGLEVTIAPTSTH